MIKGVYIFTFLISYTFFLCACSNDIQKRYKKKYYRSGRLETVGWYIQDTIPVDTLFTFYETGKILARDIYDNIGNAVKSTSYFENGKIHKIINYEKGLANGFFYTYFEAGGIASRAFYVDDLQMGDTYYYSEGETAVKAYSFFEWKERPINLMKFDSVTGRVLFDKRQAIYIDSLQTMRVNSTNDPTHKLQILISNPPRCLSVVKVEYISRNGIITKIDSITSQPYYVMQNHLPDTFSTIRISGIQYDSLSRKTTYQGSHFRLYFPK